MKRLNPFRYGLIGWLWYCPLTPVLIIPNPIGLLLWPFITPPQDRPAEEDPPEFDLMLTPNIGKHTVDKILGTACAVYKPFGYSKEDIAQALNNFVEAAVSGDPWSVRSFYTLRVTPEQRDWVLERLGKNDHLVVRYDEFEDWHDRVKNIAGDAARLKYQRELIEDALEVMVEEAEYVNEQLTKKRMECDEEEYI